MGAVRGDAFAPAMNNSNCSLPVLVMGGAILSLHGNRTIINIAHFQISLVRVTES
jgi:hypothetical protein